MATLIEVTSRFSDRVLRLLETAEHRIATSPVQREAVFRMRYEAYQRNGLLEPREDGRLHDERYDDIPDSWITVTFIGGELAGTVRVNVGAHEDALLPGLQVFRDILGPKLQDRRVVEFTRLAAKFSLASTHPELAYVIMRPAYMAAEHFEADFAVATPRAEHISFYKRVFGAALWCPPRHYPEITAKIACMAADYREVRKIIESHYPFFKSDHAERKALFGPGKIAPGACSDSDPARRRWANESSAASLGRIS